MRKMVSIRIKGNAMNSFEFSRKKERGIANTGFEPRTTGMSAGRNMA